MWGWPQGGSASLRRGELPIRDAQHPLTERRRGGGPFQNAVAAAAAVDGVELGARDRAVERLAPREWDRLVRRAVDEADRQAALGHAGQLIQAIGEVVAAVGGEVVDLAGRVAAQVVVGDRLGRLERVLLQRLSAR